MQLPKILVNIDQGQVTGQYFRVYIDRHLGIFEKLLDLCSNSSKISVFGRFGHLFCFWNIEHIDFLEKMDEFDVDFLFYT